MGLGASICHDDADDVMPAGGWRVPITTYNPATGTSETPATSVSVPALKKLPSSLPVGFGTPEYTAGQREIETAGEEERAPVSLLPSPGPVQPQPALPPSGMTAVDTEVIGVQPLTNELLVRDSSGGTYWKPGTAEQVAEAKAVLQADKEYKQPYKIPVGIVGGGPSKIGERLGPEFTGTTQKELDTFLDKPSTIFNWRGERTQVDTRAFYGLGEKSPLTQFTSLQGMGIIAQGSKFVPGEKGGWNFIPASSLQMQEDTQRMQRAKELSFPTGVRPVGNISETPYGRYSLITTEGTSREYNTREEAEMARKAETGAFGGSSAETAFLRRAYDTSPSNPLAGTPFGFQRNLAALEHPWGAITNIGRYFLSPKVGPVEKVASIPGGLMPELSLAPAVKAFSMANVGIAQVALGRKSNINVPGEINIGLRNLAGASVIGYNLYQGYKSLVPDTSKQIKVYEGGEKADFIEVPKGLSTKSIETKTVVHPGDYGRPDTLIPGRVISYAEPTHVRVGGYIYPYRPGLTGDISQLPFRAIPVYSPGAAGQVVHVGPISPFSGIPDILGLTSAPVAKVAVGLAAAGLIATSVSPPISGGLTAPAGISQLIKGANIFSSQIGFSTPNIFKAPSMGSYIPNSYQATLVGSPGVPLSTIVVQNQNLGALKNLVNQKDITPIQYQEISSQIKNIDTTLFLYQYKAQVDRVLGTNLGSEQINKLEDIKTQQQQIQQQQQQVISQQGVLGVKQDIFQNVLQNINQDITQNINQDITQPQVVQLPVIQPVIPKVIPPIIPPFLIPKIGYGSGGDSGPSWPSSKSGSRFGPVGSWQTAGMGVYAPHPLSGKIAGGPQGRRKVKYGTVTLRSPKIRPTKTSGTTGGISLVNIHRQYVPTYVG